MQSVAASLLDRFIPDATGTAQLALLSQEPSQLWQEMR